MQPAVLEEWAPNETYSSGIRARVGVVLGAPLMTVLGTKVSRKRMLMLLMGLFIAGNVLSAVARPSSA